ncbi:hypothetical protein Trydic_g12182 [Trypoxylus dichotomus]
MKVANLREQMNEEAAVASVLYLLPPSCLTVDVWKDSAVSERLAASSTGSSSNGVRRSPSLRLAAVVVWKATAANGLLDLKPIACERGLHSEVEISFEVKLNLLMDTQRCSTFGNITRIESKDFRKRNVGGRINSTN